MFVLKIISIMKKLLYLLFAITILISSCKKKEEEGSSTPEISYKLDKIEIFATESGEIRYTYNSENTKAIRADYIGSGIGLPFYLVYLYDASGNFIQQAHYNEQNELENRIDFEYDNDNNLVEVETYSPVTGGVDLEQRIEYTYDGSGNIIKEEVSYYTGASTETITRDFYYNSSNHLTHDSISQYDVILNQDVVNNYTAYETNSNGRITTQWTYWYNSGANLWLPDNKTETTWSSEKPLTKTVSYWDSSIPNGGDYVVSQSLTLGYTAYDNVILPPMISMDDYYSFGGWPLYYQVDNHPISTIMDIDEANNETFTSNFSYIEF